MHLLDSSRVAIAAGEAAYATVPPYHPETRYPEYPGAFPVTGDCPNPAYALVRESLHKLGLDREHAGIQEWNPFRAFIQPGQTVVIKPNLVRDRRETQAGLDDCVTTHGSIIRAVLDYVYIALAGRGRIIIADAPMDDADFAKLLEMTGLPQIRDFYRQYADFDIEIYDLRRERLNKVRGFIVGREELPGDPLGYEWIDLGEQSAFHEIDTLCDRLYGASYDVDETRRHHNGGRHEYLISRTVLSADCIIALPKLKTHHKVGLTVCMKLMVGICGNKNCIAHYRLGTPSQQGDQFATDGPRQQIEHHLLRAFKRTFHWWGPLRRPIAAPLRRIGETFFGKTDQIVRSGNWHGNDTAWRMAHDVTRIALYADRAGRMQSQPARKMFCLVDGIIAGEGNGPLDPKPRPCGWVIAGVQPAEIDWACAQLMGCDPQRLPLLRRATDAHRYPLLTTTPEVVEPRPSGTPFALPLGWFSAPAVQHQENAL